LWIRLPLRGLDGSMLLLSLLLAMQSEFMVWVQCSVMGG
jgi:hypothetical protein